MKSPLWVKLLFCGLMLFFVLGCDDVPDEPVRPIAKKTKTKAKAKIVRPAPTTPERDPSLVYHMAVSPTQQGPQPMVLPAQPAPQTQPRFITVQPQQNCPDGRCPLQPIRRTQQ